MFRVSLMMVKWGWEVDWKESNWEKKVEVLVKGKLFVRVYSEDFYLVKWKVFGKI